MDTKECKCPNCGETVAITGKTPNMKCPHCEAELEIKALSDYQKEAESQGEDYFNWKTGSAEIWKENDLGNLSTGSCPSCGAELIGDKNTIGMLCPWCGSAQIEEKQIEGMLKPDYCIPFKLDKKSAVEAFRRYCGGKKLLPDFFKKENRVENIQGVYAPFWLFDAKTKARVRYKAAKVNSYSDDDYDYKKTNYYSVAVDGSVDFEKMPVNGTEKMNSICIEAIEPFDYAQMSNFQGGCLAGFSAGKHEVGIEAGKEKANAGIKNTIEKEFANSIKGYSKFEVERSAVSIKGGKVSCALLPVWILNTKYSDENYQFVMNGQTGKFAGKLPVDKGKAAKYRFAFMVIFGMVFTVIIQMLRVFF